MSLIKDKAWAVKVPFFLKKKKVWAHAKTYQQHTNAFRVTCVSLHSFLFANLCYNEKCYFLSLVECNGVFLLDSTLFLLVCKWCIIFFSKLHKVLRLSDYGCRLCRNIRSILLWEMTLEDCCLTSLQWVSFEVQKWFIM